ncbi:MAG: cadherin-like beta sandwich domain-containing protein [Lachnospiraceae bacterium]|nr:cadherin-like beta sandwich domain-containing protein [Lachnospiraceae bacterium]
MKRKILAAFICIVMLISLFPQTIKADTAGASIAVSSSSIEVGETVTLTVRLNSDVEIGSYQVTLAYDSSLLEYVGGEANGGAGTLTVSNYLDTPKKNVSFDLKFKGLATGTAKVETTDGMVVAYSTMDGMSFTHQGVKVEVTASSGTASTQEGTDDNGNTEEPSNLSEDASLYSLAVSPGSISPAFHKDTTQYQVNVEEDVEELVVSAVANDTDATVTVNGNKNLTNDVNQVTIIVTAPSGNKKTYTLSVVKGDAGENPEMDGEKVEVTIDGKQLSFITNTLGVVPPEGFSSAYAEYDGKSVLVFRSKNEKITIACLVDENEANYWYMYDEEKNAFLPYIELQAKNQRYVLLDLPEEESWPKGTNKTTIEIDGRTVEVLAFSDSDTTNMYLIYAANIEGTTGFYQYDRTEGTFQRYIGDTTQEVGTAGVSNETSSHNYQQYNKILKGWALLSIVIILLLLGIIFIISTKKSEDELEDSEEDEWEEEDEEEEGIDMSELAATLDIEIPKNEPVEKENDMEFIQSILDGEDEIETILPEDLDNLPKVSRYNNDKDWL